MSEHALISPSAAKRILACSASLAMSLNAPRTSNSDADRGTAMHYVAEQIVAGAAESAFDYLGDFLQPSGCTEEVEFDADMAEQTQEYIEGLYASLREGSQLRLEYRVTMSDFMGFECFGTMDALIVHPDGTFEVHDLKTGRKWVNPERNIQLILYAFGVIHTASPVGKTMHPGLRAEKVRLVIHQPALNFMGEWWTTYGEIYDAVTDFKRLVAFELINAGTVGASLTFNPGEVQCEYCPAKATCPALRELALNTTEETPTQLPALPSDMPAKPSLSNPSALDNEWLAVCKSRVKLIEKWCEAVNAEANRRALEGQIIPGFKLVEGRQGNRKWVDDELAAEALIKAGLSETEAYVKKTLSPAQADKKLGKGVMDYLTTRSEGRPTLVPLTDKGTPISIKNPTDDLVALDAPKE